MDKVYSLLGDEADMLQDLNLQVMLLANLLPPLGSALLSPIMDSLTRPFSVSAAEIGLMMSAFTAPPVLMIPIIGILADRYGRKPILVGGLILFGIGGTAIALTTNFRIILGLRLLQGIGFAGITPIIITSIGDLYSGTKEATAQGFRFTSSGLSQGIFPIVAGFLVMLGWRYPFLLFALAFPLALLVYFIFDEPVQTDGSGPEVNRTTSEHLRALYSFATQSHILAIVIGRGLPVTIWIGFLTYNSIIVIRILGGSPFQAGLLAAMGSLTYAGAASQLGRITSQAVSRFYPLIVANVVMVTGFALVVLAPSLGVMALGVLIMGIGFGVLNSMYRSLITNLTDVSLRGGFVGLSESSSRLMGTLAPIVMGLIIESVSPQLGFNWAVRVTGVAIVLVIGIGGLVCLMAAKNTFPVSNYN